MAGEEPLLHVLAVAFPIPGHTNSLMHVCRALVSPAVGFKVTFVCSTEEHEGASRTRDLGDSSSSGDKVRVIGLLSVVGLEDLVNLASKMGPLLEELVQKLSDEGHPVACILTDSFNGWTQDVANKFSLPRAVYGTSNATNDATYHFLPQLMAQGFVPVTSCTRTELIDFLPGLPPLHPRQLPLSFYCHHPFLGVIADGANRFLEADFALCNTFEELEPEVISALRRNVKANYFTVGPCLPPDFLVDHPSVAVDRGSDNEAPSPDDIRCLDWLDKQVKGSVLYIAFGSVATFSMEQAQEVAKALEMAGKPFLFAVRKNLVSGSASVDFFDQFAERTRELGLVVAWAPQMQVLRHPSVGAFLTHCGWNSTLEAICSGVPLLGWPQMAEQNMNCAIISKLKFGVEVLKEAAEDGLVSGAKLAKLFQMVLGDEGEELRTRARELSQTAKRAVSQGGSSTNNLKAFARALRERAPAAAK